MKAILLAGGRGTRLRPLTGNLPKPLVPLLGKPVLFHILELLRQHGVEEAAVTLGFRGHMLEEALEEVKTPRLYFSREDIPLGTAGGARLATRLLKLAPGEPVLIISGDAMCDFDLSAALQFHRESGSMATLLAHRVADPREYGLICTDDSNQILSFVEKPSYAGCLSELANTGIYLLNAEALGRIPIGKPYDFARDLFPEMLRQGMPLYTWEAKGYWCDIGDVKSYLRCQADMLAGDVAFEHPYEKQDGIWLTEPLPVGNYRLNAPVCIGRDVSIGDGAVIGPDCVLGDNVCIGAGCEIQKSIVGNGAILGSRVRLSEAVVDGGAVLEQDSAALPSSVIGAGARIGRDAIIGEGVHVWENRNVGEGVLLREDLQAGTVRELIIGEDGFTGSTQWEITPEICLRIGMGAASLPREMRGASAIGVGWGSKGASAALAQACIAGIMAAGGSAWNFGECPGVRFDFCLSKSQCDFGIYVDAGLSASVRVVGRGGLPICREEERALECAVNRHEYLRAEPGKAGTAVEMASMVKLYEYEVLRQCGIPLEGMRILVRSTSKPMRESMEGALRLLGVQTDDGEDAVLLRLSPDGRAAEMEEAGVVLSPERMLAAACLTELFRKMPVALPADAPHAIDTLAERFGSRVLRYQDGASDPEARRLALSQPWLRDGLQAAVRVLAFLKRQKLSLRELETLLPGFCLDSRLIPLSATARPGRILQRLGDAGLSAAQPQGLELHNDMGHAAVRPLKSGGGLLILAECMQALQTSKTASETASELCDIVESLVRKACNEEEEQQ